MGRTLDKDTKFYIGRDMNNIREKDHPRERYSAIELSDLEYLERLRAREYKASTFPNELSKIEASFDPDMLSKNKISENQTRKGVKNAKSKSKVTERKPKKNVSKSNKAAVARIQDKL